MRLTVSSPFFRALCGAALALVPCAATLNAQVVFDNGAPETSSGRLTLASRDYSSINSFVLSENVTLDQVSWWGGMPVGPGDEYFWVALYDEVGGVPSIESFYVYEAGYVTKTDPGVNSGGVALYHYSTSIAPVTLEAGHRYWLEIYAPERWYWSLTAAPTDTFSAYGGGVQTAWSALSELDYAFTLSGSPADPVELLEQLQSDVLALDLPALARFGLWSTLEWSRRVLADNWSGNDFLAVVFLGMFESTVTQLSPWLDPAVLAELLSSAEAIGALL